MRTKLVFSFLFVVLAGGILSSLIGTQLVADTIILQAQNKVKHDLNTAWLVYNESLNRIQDIVQLTALRANDSGVSAIRAEEEITGLFSQTPQGVRS